MSERDDALKALDQLGCWAAAGMAPSATDIVLAKSKVRAAINRGYPPEDGDPVGGESGWVIEITNGKEWFRLHILKNDGLFPTEEEALEWSKDIPNSWVRRIGDGE